MNPEQNQVAEQPMPVRAIGGLKEDAMTLKKYKRLTDFAYRVKDFIDVNGGLDYEESCVFGDIMQRIIRLK